MKVADLRKEFGNKFKKKIRTKIITYNEEYVHFLENKLLSLLTKENTVICPNCKEECTPISLGLMCDKCAYDKL